MKKKIISTILAALIACGSLSLAACDRGENVEQIDKSKTQIYVSNFNGGFGSEWLDKIKTSFEEDYKDASFESGKKGVQVVIKKHKNLGSAMVGTLTDDSNYVFFLEDVPYGEMVYGNQILDITDVVNGTFDINTATGDNTIPDVTDKNIIGKFSDIQASSLAIESKYYAIPHYEGYYGFTYDADLFEKKHYYMGYDPDEYPNYDPANPDLNKVEFSTGFSINDGNLLSPGPDGIHGTYDDGLPVTYADFYKLCEQMTSDGVTPMIWSGQYGFYISNAINQLIADYNGYDNETLGYTFNGKSTKYVTGFDGNGNPIIGEKDITNANGYDYFKQAGHYYGLSFLEKLVDTDGFLYKDCFTGSFSHTDAQNNYLLSGKVNTMKPIAMLAEGIWWQNEASGQFSAMEKAYPNSGKTQRNLKFMPMPKATKADVGATTLLESQNSYMVIRKNVDEQYIPLCKLFVQYVNQTEKLQEFTLTSNTPKALKYEMTDTQMSQLTPFAKSIMEIKNAKNKSGVITTKVVYQLSTNPLYLNNKSKFKKYETLAYGTNTYPATAFNDTKSLTAKDYFNGLYDSWKGRWNSDFAAYLTK